MVIFVAKRIWAGEFEQLSYSNLIMFIALIWIPTAGNNTTP